MKCGQVRKVLFRCADYITGRQTTEDNYPHQLRWFLLESCTDLETYYKLLEVFVHADELVYSKKHHNIPEEIIIQEFESIIMSVLNQDKDLFNLLKTPENATLQARSKLVQGLFNEHILYKLKCLEDEFNVEVNVEK